MSGFLVLPDGRTVTVEDGMVIGRVHCEIEIDDTKASRRHARLIVSGGVVEIEDLGSSNGTLLNGKKVERRMLRDGDVVQIGTTSLRYTERQEAEPPKPAVPATPSSPAAGDELSFEDDLSFDEDSPIVTPPPPKRATPPAAKKNVEVLEFVDEVVEVIKRESASPEFATRKPTSTVQRTGRDVLQFNKGTDSKGLLGDDLSQMSTGMRALLVVGVLAIAVALGYIAMRVVQ